MWKEAKVVLDPTLLLSSDEWDKLWFQQGKITVHSLLFLGNNEETWNM